MMLLRDQLTVASELTVDQRLYANFISKFEIGDHNSSLKQEIIVEMTKVSIDHFCYL